MDETLLLLLLKSILVVGIVVLSSYHLYYGLFLCISVILLYHLDVFHERNPDFIERFTDSSDIGFHSYVINLDKNPERLEKIQGDYNNTDLKIVPFQRFPAVLGKNVNMSEWLPVDTQKEIKEVEKRGYRHYTYQLTKGAIGCFMSHYQLAKQLTTDDTTDNYLILEDDAQIESPILFEKIQNYCKNAPEDWDMILFGHINTTGNVLYEDENFTKPTGFWQTHAYMINKRGARKFIDEVNQTKIDGQLDAYFSRMQQQKKINIYGTKETLFVIKFDENWSTNIQIDLKPIEGTNSHDFKGYIV